MISEIVQDCNKMESWQAIHTPRDANVAVHQLACWATAEFSSGSNPNSSEHSLKLPWVYASTDPPL